MTKRKKQKRVLLQFYSNINFGDDFFLKIIGDYFKEVQFRFILHPKWKIDGLPSNVQNPKLLSLVLAVLNKLLVKLKDKPFLRHRLYLFIESINKKYAERFDAVVFIGGSVFMQHSANKRDEINFTLPPEIKRDFSPVCKIKPGEKGEFIINANFGPYYDEDYRQSVENILLKKNAVSVRDYSSYALFKNLENVQYAPDVVFMYNPQSSSKPADGKKHAFVSLTPPADSEKGTRALNTVSYFRLLTDSINELLERDFTVDLVSFCKNEGDLEICEKLYAALPEKQNVFIHSYDGNLNSILSLVSQSDFVIASRFHSMILGFLYGKPTFPVAYNCKTVNYLADLNFSGRYAHKDNLSELTVNDVLYNYDNNIICDVTQHRKHAKNQFYALDKFLNS